MCAGVRLPSPLHTLQEKQPFGTTLFAATEGIWDNIKQSRDCRRYWWGVAANSVVPNDRNRRSDERTLHSVVAIYFLQDPTIKIASRAIIRDNAFCDDVVAAITSDLCHSLEKHSMPYVIEHIRRSKSPENATMDSLQLVATIGPLSSLKASPQNVLTFCPLRPKSDTLRNYFPK